MPESYFFDHDYNARNDDKILEMRSEYKAEGYGVFWMIVETMAENENGGINTSLMGGLSLGYGVSKEWLLGFVSYCVRIDLFYEQDGFIYSKRMLGHKKLMKSYSEYGRQGAIKRWGGDRGAISGGNAKKEKREEKEKKENTTVSGGKPPEANKVEVVDKPAKPVSKSKKKLDAEPFWKELVTVYFSFCWDMFNEKPSFDGSSPSDMHRIIECLKKRAAERNVEWTEETAKLRWREFLGRAFQDDWLKQNWLLSNLNRHKDKVFLNLISHKNGTHQQIVAPKNGTSEARTDALKGWGLAGRE